MGGGGRSKNCRLHFESGGTNRQDLCRNKEKNLNRGQGMTKFKMTVIKIEHKKI